ncbi:indolepyruvate ferredoxin oxidoreductase subunit alpha [Clostridium beijerinckii]|uniref:indolepyruvate ferredoxin oxidoreductase subunit alpha n=1 Tax=Clostridium beijerinckii TaxID=1520 RepID=UPI002226BBA7|nr:indolepyruvate ferredoxin oxidoreductase subunit alpha [Clostridium beijerinckii]UYZ35651.1 indolepyruvate ferredoxin oxidoreductase subunit alpha [Clostridium beijerinckii]
MKVLLTGNEAIARGAYEAGAKLAAGYPGTPVTGVMESTMKNYKDIYCEWSVNEKVALEVAIGSSFAGYRSFVVMKTVGLNVAHDALMAAAQSKINGGLVLVVADDVGRITDDHNDCRYFGESAGIPILEPSDSDEAKEYTKLAFEISEQYSLPVIIRVTSVTCKTGSFVNIDENYVYKAITNKKYDCSSYAVLATTTMIGMKNCTDSRILKYHNDFVGSLKKLGKASNSMSINSMEINDSEIGIITAGVTYCYTKEVMPDASILKLGLINPLPENLIKEFASKVKKIYVIEDGQNVLEKNIKSLGIDVIGEALFEKFPNMTYFTPAIIEEKLSTKTSIRKKPRNDVPFRLPMNCAGCSHIFINHILKKNKIKASTDVTCGGLGAFPHINAFNNAKNMGSSISIAHGYNIVSEKEQKYVAVIGDGGFWATGINGLINLVYNNGNSAVIIVENSCIAMTGGQSLPSGEFGVNYNPENRLDIADVCRDLGVKNVKVVDPYEIDNLEKAILEAVESDEASIVVVEKDCLVKFKPEKSGICSINNNKCIGCKSCLNVGCLALEYKPDSISGKVLINKDLCVGCKLCMNICKKEAIEYEER